MLALEQQRQIALGRIGWWDRLLCNIGLLDLDWLLFLEAQKFPDTKDLADELGARQMFGASDC